MTVIIVQAAENPGLTNQEEPVHKGCRRTDKSRRQTTRKRGYKGTTLSVLHDVADFPPIREITQKCDGERAEDTDRSSNKGTTYRKEDTKED